MSAASNAPGSNGPGLVALGRIGRAHGIRGDVRVTPYNAGSTLLTERSALHVGGELRAVRWAKPAGDVVLLALEGVTTREAAEALRGMEVAIPRDELPAPEEDELYLTDLVGCTCWDGTTPLGTVVAVETYPASDCLVIESETESGTGRREVPACAPYLAAIDLVARRIEIAHAADFPVEHPRVKKQRGR